MPFPHDLTPEERRAGNQGRGRPHALADPEYAKLVASMFVAGASRREMAAELNVGEDTIGRWRKDPRIKAHARGLIEDRIIQITRRVDATIEARLNHAEALTTRELLEIRKEFLAGTLRTQTEKIDEGTVSEAMAAIEKNPDLINDILNLLERKAQPPQGGLVTEPQDGISEETLGEE